MGHPLGHRTSFSRFQERMQVEKERDARKRVLREAVSWDDPVRWTPHRNE